MTERKYLYLETFGCQMNVNDSEKIAGMLKGLDYELTADPELADLVILNTCSVRAKAESKVYDYLGRYKKRKRGEGKPLILGVGGCVAQQEGERLRERVPYLDLVFGTHNLHHLPDMVRAAERGERTEVLTGFIDNETRVNLFPTADEGEGTTRFVTIMQGCDNFCSYCIVPYVRGREISRRSGDVIEEIRVLAERGVREVTLLGQNVNSYGLKNPEEVDFAGLLREIAAIEGVVRIRFTTSHPKDISPQLVRCFAEIPKLCGHIHLPAQSGSDRVLARMNRGYSRGEYLERVAALRAVRPDMWFTGDIIVGFPGETAEDFEQTMSLVEEVRYADLFSFVYSARPETAAAAFADQLSREEKLARLDRLQKRQREISQEMSRALVGSIQEVLAEGRSRRGDQLAGRTEANRVVNFDGDDSLIGTLVPVEIIRSYPNSLLGKLHSADTVRKAR